MTSANTSSQKIFSGRQRVLFNSLVTAGGLFLVLLALPFLLEIGRSEALADEPVQTVPVVLSEFTIQPTSFAFGAGDRVVFEIENRGAIAHEFRLTSRVSAGAHAEGGHDGHDDSAGGSDEGGDIWRLINPGQTETLEVSFDEHSPYDLVACMLPGHYEAGMTQPLRIAGVMAHAVADDHGADDHGADDPVMTDDHGADDPAMTDDHGADDHAMADDHEDGATTVTEVDREVFIFMDEFEFDPPNIEVVRGETVRFTIINAGGLRHEFRLTTEHAALEHVGSAGPGHHPEDAGDLIVALDPGAAGTLVVTFDDDVVFDTLACFLDDHYQSGLSASLTITS